MKLELGKGAGRLVFGMEQEKVEAILGKPTEIENDGEYGVNWHYDELEMSVSFDSEASWKLVTIAISNEDAMLAGVNLIGKDEQSVLNVIKSLGLTEPEVEEIEAEGDLMRILAFEEKSVNFWFEGDTLTEIQIWPFINDNEEIIWPN